MSDTRMEQSALFAIEPAPKPERRVERIARAARVYQRAKFEQTALIDLDSEEYAGWEEELDAPRPTTWPSCRPPDGQRCGRVSCSMNLRLDLPMPIGKRVEGDESWIAINRGVAVKRVGRRPSLSPAAPSKVAEKFIDDAANVDELNSSACTLIEIERHGAMAEQMVAERLGVDEETVRRETVSAIAKLRSLASKGGNRSPDDPEEGLLAILRAMTGRER